MPEDWGIIGLDSLDQPRIRRDLGLAAVVRYANDYSVPGLAGLSFLRAIVWSLVGIEFAAALRSSGTPTLASEVAEAIEALASWHALKKDPRLDKTTAYRIRGSTKLDALKEGDLKPSRLRRGKGYVSQPIRMGMSACLPRLGLVDAANSRFNSYSLNDNGKEFLRLAIGDSDPKRALPTLWAWVEGADLSTGGGPKAVVGKDLRLISALDPIASDSGTFFSGRMLSFGTTEEELRVRRCLWQTCQEILSTDETRDSDALALKLRERVKSRDAEVHGRLEWANDFFETFAAAISVLDQVAFQLSQTNGKDARISKLLETSDLGIGIKVFRDKVEDFARLPRPPSPPPVLADFLRIVGRSGDIDILNELIRRDEKLLRIDGEGRTAEVSLLPNRKVSSPAEPDQTPSDEPVQDQTRLYRLSNLCKLCCEVKALQ
jgi:hypothetical protein